MENISFYIIIFLLIIFYNYIEISFIKFKSIKIRDNKLKGKFKVSQISDFHNSKFISYSSLKKGIIKFNPDIIVLTGDIIDRKTNNLNNIELFLKELKKINKKIYFVAGNHELNNPLYEDFLVCLERFKVDIIEGETRIIEHAEEKINLLGLGINFRKEEYDNLLNQIDLLNYTIIISHNPFNFFKIDRPVEDLVLAGHTHGGQVRLPVIGSILGPEKDFFPKLDKGLYYIKERYVYIDSGLGNSTLNIRLFNRIQVSNIEIN